MRYFIGGKLMIINNIIIGVDSRGNKLECGDICLFNYKNEREEVIKSKGLIIYDEDSYSFVFEQLDDNFPLLLMNKVERDTIIKLYHITHMDKFTTSAEKWVEIYNSNLLVAHLD